MRKIGLALLVGWVVIMSYSVSAEPLALNDPIYLEIESNVLKPFFEALKNGDVSSLLGLISGEMYKNNRVLLEQNKQYPEFLRKYYSGAKFRVEKAVQMNGEVVVDVLIEFPSGRQSTNRWRLSESTGNQLASGQMSGWKIINSEEKKNF